MQKTGRQSLGSSPHTLWHFIWFCVFNRLYFLEQFQAHSKLEEKLQRFPYALLPHPHSPLRYQHPHRCGAFVTADESALTHHYHPEPTDLLGFASGAMHSVDLDRCTTPGTRRYTAVLSQCHCSKNTPSSTDSSLPPNPWPPRVSLLPASFCLLGNVADVKSHSMQPFYTGFFHLLICI